MKILWITNVELPKIAKHFNREVFVGGWLDQTSKLLSIEKDVELHILSMVDDEYDDILIDDIHYYSFKDNDKNRLEKIILNNNFDLIHIWGTEYEHSLLACQIAKNNNFLDRVVISIQGLVSYISKYHYNSYIPQEDFNKKTIVESLTNKSNESRKKQMYERGLKEIECLKLAKHCIGRTDWDEACVKLINPDINYYYCHEILRSGFYKYEWHYDKCDKYTIFFSQTNNPIKGFHLMLEGLKIVKEFYPNVKLKALGGTKNNLDKFKGGAYRKYILDLINKYDLNNNIEFLGSLNEEEMIKEYLSCNIFVSASTIENSSNSISEAMLLGVPVIASDVGGIKSMLIHNKEGILYQADAPYMLASNIMKLFKDDKKSIELGKNARTRALKDHDVETNMKLLMNIYKSTKGTENE